MVQDFATQAATSVCSDALRHIHVWFVAAHVEFSIPPSRHTSWVLRQLLHLFSSWELRTAQVGSSAITEDREHSITEARSKDRRTESAFIVSPLTRTTDCYQEKLISQSTRKPRLWGRINKSTNCGHAIMEHWPWRAVRPIERGLLSWEGDIPRISRSEPWWREQRR
jgi:hypothetical protein